MEAVSGGVDTTKNVIKTVGNVSQSLQDVSKYLLPAALIGGSVLLILYLKKQKYI